MSHQTESVAELHALGPEAYDEQWSRLDDFIKWNPGARHRRRVTQRLIESTPLISRTTSGSKVSRILDVGCGPGEYLTLLSEIFGSRAKITGVDLSPQVIAKNQSRFPWAEFSALDITQESLNSKFDLIVCCEVLEHIEKRSEAFANLAKMLDSGGYLFVSCPAGKIHETEKSFGHVSHPTVDELQGLALANGLVVDSLTTWGFPMYSFTKFLVNLNPEKSLKSFADGDYSFVQKLICSVIYYANFFNFRNSRKGVELFFLAHRPE